MINNVKIEGGEVTIQLSGDGSLAFLADCVKLHCSEHDLATVIINDWFARPILNRRGKLELATINKSIDSPLSAEIVSNPATRAGTTSPEGSNSPGYIDHIPGPLANPG